MKLGNFVATNENLGQENEQDLTTLNEGKEAVLLEAEAVTNGEAEIETAGTAVDDIEQGLETVDTSSELIEDAQEVLDDGEGGEMASDAEIISVESLVSNIRSNLGVEPFVVMTTESRLRTKRSDLVATLEAEKQSMVARAAAGIKAMMNAVVSFFRQLFQNVGSLEKYVEGLKKQVAAYDESKAGEGTVSGKFADGQAAVAAMNGVVKLMAVSEKAMASFESKMNGVKDASVDNLEEALKGMSENLKATFTDAHSELGDVSFSNNQKLTEEFTPGESGNIESSKRLSKSEMSSVLNAASAAVTALKNGRKIENRLTSMGKNILTFLSILGNSAKLSIRGEDKAPESKTRIVERMYVTAFTKVTGRFGRSVPSFAFKNVKAAADYVKMSLN